MVEYDEIKTHSGFSKYYMCGEIVDRECRGCRDTGVIINLKETKCKACICLVKKIFRENNKEKLSKKSKIYRLKNKDTIKQNRKAYAEKNKDIIKQRKKEYRKNNKDIIKNSNTRFQQRLKKDPVRYGIYLDKKCEISKRLYNNKKSEELFLKSLEFMSNN